MGKGSLRFSATVFLFIVSFVITCRSQSAAEAAAADNDSDDRKIRKAIEIIIGGGGLSPPSPPPESGGNCPECAAAPQPALCPPPPAPPPPPPPPQPSTPGYLLELKTATKVIQKFGKKVGYDPYNITRTWNGTVCIDNFIGIFCDKLKGKLTVAGINFNGRRLDGSQKEHLSTKGLIDSVTENLVFFHANSNNFTGSIPSQLSKFRYFYELDFSNNKFTGPFPETVLGFQLLTFLDLRFNQFTGPLPPRVFTLDLDVLFLNNNIFDGQIPANLGSTPALYLTLANNRFTGPIPKSIGQAANTLLEVLFLNNTLSGCLPYEIGLLRKATVFDASKNKITGPIPHSFECLAKIELLTLCENQLYGTVPESLCKISTLQKLDLKFNYFTQVGPECRNLIKKKVLEVNKNCILDLPNQRSAAECAAFFSQQISCPDARSMNYVPCDIHNIQSESEEPIENQIRPQLVPSPSPSYAALGTMAPLIKH